MKRALITGITGQDGSYLAELLLDKGYQVFGLVRRASTNNLTRIAHLARQLHLLEGDVTSAAIAYALRESDPHEVYHLAAQSHVATSFHIPDVTFAITGAGTVDLLEAIRQSRGQPRFYNAATSELYGDSPPPQAETTPFHPCSPYAVAKLAGYWWTRCYRQAYGLFACNGILFNHESPRRTETFVTRKITLAAARIRAGLQDKLFLGNLDAKRDWGWAPDYVEAMWLMLQQDKPDDFVIATGETHTVREFVEAVFSWHGLDWQKYVEIDPRLYRPAEVHALCGDASKAREKLGWKPSVGFRQLAERMAEADAAFVGTVPG